ncbi:MAG: GAF domain-containing protein [Bacteriovoracaceae bacterium]
MIIEKQSRSSMNLNELEAYLTGYWPTDLSNFSAYIFHHLPDLNWVGFYLNDGQKLRLGPFHGKPACMEIPFHRGVCGKSFTEKEILLVDDVHEFPGHIACDSASRSEMVFPFYIDGQLAGVLDIDSPTLARFTNQDKEQVKAALQILSTKLENSKERSLKMPHEL